MSGRFVIPETVHATPDDRGNLTLLNQATGRWHLLNRTGAEFYQSLRAHQDIQTAIDSLVRRHPDVPAGQIQHDIELLVSALVARGLLVPDELFRRQAAGILMTLPPTSQPNTRLQGFTALVAFPVALLLLKMPFRVTTAAVTRLKHRLCRRKATIAEAQGVLSAARRAGRFHPGRVACLEESLTAVLAAAIIGYRVDWCFGFAVDPLSFHAWIAVDGSPVTDNSDDPINSTYRQVLVI
ncbi:lasso peptide biosynthesis B2 protein [Kibdelosporangium persicum]|uniref:Coenzyme PQQ synthesis protein D (PqqD) n=1 Tax=Kibdelosporangium persicum TaxID=2698649 RepID=A0ABX2FI59_9PSEU|nr:lasso peptide biosynthesis B2 protein [Kibdelosporangium persicum]NRN71080.1 Coenzyme PQQ synthesis protein D (PqqD) [Kibdelosporangium persicum]